MKNDQYVYDTVQHIRGGFTDMNLTIERYKCWAIVISKSVQDARFSIKSYQGDPIAWSVYQKEAPEENNGLLERPDGQELLIRTE